MMNFPKFRFEIEDMKMSMIAALNDRHDDLLKAINIGIDAYIEQLPSQIASMSISSSREFMQEAMESALKEYWETGAGQKIIQAMIKQQVGGK